MNPSPMGLILGSASRGHGPTENREVLTAYVLTCFDTECGSQLGRADQVREEDRDVLAGGHPCSLSLL